MGSRLGRNPDVSLPGTARAPKSRGLWWGEWAEQGKPVGAGRTEPWDGRSLALGLAATAVTDIHSC